ncbi:MAG TPA: carbohydrate kinase family protein, partial [Thermomicrobiales bacterium]|nr:carbohydrate kinase family protein [Thermomicrobiales bacterium]
LKNQRGGVGGNIAYNLALLGVPSALVGAVGGDFGPYRAVMERLGVDMSNIAEFESDFTSTSFMNSDLAGNQIAAFYPGAGAHSDELDVTEQANHAVYGLVGAAAPEAMRKHAAEIAGSHAKLIYDPSQQIVVLPGDDLAAGIEIAEIVVGNDYEFGMIERKTGLTLDDITAKVPFVAVTYGERGSELRTGGERVAIPAAPPVAVKDPTGGGDAYRAGLIKGLLLGDDLPIAGRIAALAATYAIEQHGTQEHTYTPVEFIGRFDAAFPDFAGALPVSQFSESVSLTTQGAPR